VPANFSVTGEAPGTWFFEASFPVQIVDANDNTIYEGHAQALSDWMTTAMVPFKADVAISGGYKGAAKLILMNDNPSGDPSRQLTMFIPITIQ
jgi:hypothetical protein